MFKSQELEEHFLQRFQKRGGLVSGLAIPIGRHDNFVFTEDSLRSVIDTNGKIKGMKYVSYNDTWYEIVQAYVRPNVGLFIEFDLNKPIKISGITLPMDVKCLEG